MDLLILPSISLNCLVCFYYLLIFSALNPHSLIPSLAVSNLFNLTTEFFNFNDFYFHFPPNLSIFSVLFLFTYSISSFILIIILNMIWQYIYYLITSGFLRSFLILFFVVSTKSCCNVPCNLRVWTHIHQGFSCRIFFWQSRWNTYHFRVSLCLILPDAPQISLACHSF